MLLCHGAILLLVFALSFAMSLYLPLPSPSPLPFSLSSSPTLPSHFAPHSSRPFPALRFHYSLQSSCHPRIISSPAALTLDRSHQESVISTPSPSSSLDFSQREQQWTLLSTSDTTLPLRNPVRYAFSSVVHTVFKKRVNSIVKSRPRCDYIASSSCRISVSAPIASLLYPVSYKQESVVLRTQ